ncbi:C3HC4 type (RING finger) zinc finger containing protein [Cladophialophora carrionii]|uniref:E3 ubiquitin-protein ligase listerin n=1 Tax=Cladophialophora carrionii TaxID=86049 RepID=A0A1C1CFE7_9EURO|nr:C3HC4 type (RING finger) zinc finger containing protein [Cladophialophora carrionii]
MSKKFKSQASAASARAASATFGSFSPGPSFGAPGLAGFRTAPSPLSYIAEQPELSTITDANLVVTLRNLGKKDSTTKAKALEDLQDYVGSLGSGEAIETGLLDAWISLYPRTSIDNSRRVRQLAHTLQGSLTTLAGKRIAPQLPKVIGAWLSGLYDSDRLVARAAQDSVSTAFNSEDKRRALWKVYRGALVDYANDAILVQTPQTLSDERSTTPDNAESKFVRVVGNAVQLLSQIVKVNYPAGRADKLAGLDSIKMILEEKKLWEYSSHQDPTLRRALCSLAKTCADTIAHELDWKTLSGCFIGKALHSNQLGSSRQLSEALLSLTSVRPEIWTIDYTSKTAASKRLFQFLRKGSQRGPVEFWSDVKALIKGIPLEAWSTIAEDGKVRLEDGAVLLESLRAGVTSSEEPRQNLEAAWSSYVEISFWLLERLGDEQSRVKLLEDNALPLVTEYAASEPSTSLWVLPSTCNAEIAASILVSILHRGMHSCFETTWTRLCQSLGDHMKLSLPESSKDFVKSQDKVISQVQRLFRLKRIILDAQHLPSSEKPQVADVIRRSDESLVVAAIELLKARNGKPYGAAGVLETVVAPTETLSKSLELFLGSDALRLLASPSAEYLVALLLRARASLAQVFTALVSAGDGPSASAALGRLAGDLSEEECLQIPDFEPFIVERISSQLETSTTQQVVKSILQNPKLTSSALHKRICQRLVDQLSPDNGDNSQQVVLRFVLSLLSDRTVNPSPFSGDVARLLLAKLLLLTESGDEETAELASALLGKLKSTPTGTSSTAVSSAALVADQLSGKGDPLPVFVLVDLGKDTLKALSSPHGNMLDSLLPTTAQWENSLKDHITRPPPPSISITSPLRGLISVITPVHASTPTLSRDSEGHSYLFRLFLYVTKMMHATNLSTVQSEEQLLTLYTYYPLALEIVNENLTMESQDGLWHNTSNEVVEEAAEALSQGTSLVQKWLQDDKFIKLWVDAIRSTDSLDPGAYYHGLAFTNIASGFVDEHGSALLTSAFEAEIKDLHHADEVVRSASLVSACRHYFISSQQGRKLLNELIGAVTGVNVPSTSNMALRPLILLDILLSGSPEPVEGIPSQRQNFLMQTLVRILSDPSAESNLQALTIRLLEPIVAAVKDLYGEHWERMLHGLAAILQNRTSLNEDLPVLHASLRLCGRLRTLAKSDGANEDLVEAWEATESSIEEGLLDCLRGFSDSLNGTNQPTRITAELLRRQLSQIPARHDVSLYPFLSSAVDSVQGAAYDLLHRSIPAEQEQVSLDVALEQKAAHLPTELLELLLDMPQTSARTDVLLQRGYLLCWSLVFDHFPKASYKLQELYTADLKEKGVVGDLLELICDVCRITSSHPLDASKTQLKDFEIGTSETEKQEEQRLTLHLYYCCLLFLPGLTRSWFIEQKNRVKSPLESWTQKYFSPALISAAAATVTNWVQSQSQDEGDSPMTIKTSLSGSETVASIAVDPESPPISLAISLPKSYPLDSPSVFSRTRVGVSEKNWQSWLRTIQIIIFSTGSIIEGLVAFRRNVQGVLKGQSECAICYSIIGTDMQIPNKRCGTCRNTFHGACLFRWFKSSNSSSCPLCRNNFNYA